MELVHFLTFIVKYYTNKNLHKKTNETRFWPNWRKVFLTNILYTVQVIFQLKCKTGLIASLFDIFPIYFAKPLSTNLKRCIFQKTTEKRVEKIFFSNCNMVNWIYMTLLQLGRYDIRRYRCNLSNCDREAWNWKFR